MRCRRSAKRRDIAWNLRKLPERCAHVPAMPVSHNTQRNPLSVVTYRLVLRMSTASREFAAVRAESVREGERFT